MKQSNGTALVTTVEEKKLNITIMIIPMHC